MFNIPMLMNKPLSTIFIAAVATLMPLCANASEAAYFSTDFNTADLSKIGFSTLDVNGDGNTWTPQNSTVTFRNLDGQSITAVDKTPTLIGNYENDDWLFTPALTFEAGKTYAVTIVTAKLAYAAIDNGYEVMLGTAKNASAMTTTLVAREDGVFPQFGGNSLWTKECVITVPATGDYFIGIHAIGKPGQKFGITDLSIANGVAMITPAAISDLTLTPAPSGDKKVTISFTTPTTAKDGSRLTSVNRVEIYRDGDFLKALQNPEPGSKQSVEDIVAVSGKYTYSARAFTDAGGGDMASATTFIGINTPAGASDVLATNTGLRSAHITWTAPTIDKDGYPIAASLLTYDVYRKPLYSNEPTQLATGLVSLSYDDTVAESEDLEAPAQQFYTYSVVAKTIEGEAAPVAATPVPLGKPYDVPYLESFPRGRAQSIFTSTALEGNNYWSVSTDFEDVASADADNGMVYLNGQIGGAAAYHSGLIDLGDMASPTLNYYTYNITGCDPADHRLQVVVTATDGTTKAFDAYVPAYGWNKTILPLDEFVGKVIRAEFRGYRENSTELHLDAIAVSNIFRTDLKATAINLPTTIRTSEPFSVVVDVLNYGSQPVDNYQVELYCDGRLVDTYSGSTLSVGAYDYVAFTRTHGIMDNAQVTYSAKVICAADQDIANNETESATATIRKNAYPVVTDLSGSLANGKVTLTWSEPDTEKAQPYEVLETFESYDPWATSGVGDWVFVDRDKATIAGFSEGTMPGIPAYSQQSWWVFDNSHEDFNNGSFSTLSGTKFLASMVSGVKGEGFVQNDDWAISPELFGGPQTISVNARSYDLAESGRESFEILYSTGSVDPADFTSLKVFNDIASEYTAYLADLPDGAKRFAIRNISNGKFVLMVDDVTYIPVGDPAAFSINGYNVYRDGVMLNSEPVEENEFVDADCGDGRHTYNVSVIYSAGESQLSNDFNPLMSGIEAISPEAAGRAVYYNLQGIRVNHLEPGRLYIRHQGGKVTKVIGR